MCYSRLIRFFILSFVTILFSCEKAEKRKISGQILQSCDNQKVVSGVVLSLYYLEKSSGLGGKGRSFEYTTTTNEDGIFTFSFEEKSWGSSALGTFGAELQADGRTILTGITSEDKHLGDVFQSYNTEFKLYVAITARNLQPTDSVFVNQEFIGTGNFSAFEDTLTVPLCHANIPDDRYKPSLNRVRGSCVNWYIKSIDSDYTHGSQYVPRAEECDVSGPAYIIVEPQ